MELIGQLLDLVLHLDKHLAAFVQSHGGWIYFLLFMIVFAETGLVITPFLPGDSLLFVAGTLAAAGGMDVVLLMVILIIAAILGDTVNYWVGHLIGPRVFRRKESLFFKPQYLEYTHAFFERHGGKTIIIGRFLPIIRTFAPFVAGIGSMTYGRFLLYNVAGAFLWVVSLVMLGFLFGNLRIVKENLTLVIVGIIILSLVPGFIEYLRHRRRAG
jgi:membrane-associated protein